MDEARRLYGERPDLTLTPDALAAADGADALAIVTEWTQFRSPDFGQIRQLLKEPVVFDGRNVFDSRQAIAAGLTYFSIGRTARRPD